MIRLSCPACQVPLPATSFNEECRCEACSATYPLVEGILSLVRPDRRTQFERMLKQSDVCWDQSTIDEESVVCANLRYHEAHAADYEMDVSTEEVFSAASTARIREVIDLARTTTRGQDWLDVGCGTGHVLALASGIFPSTVGVDLSVAMLNRAAARGLRVVQGEAQHLPVLDESVDVVSAFSFLHHLYDVAGFYREAYRVLRPGGLFYSDYDPNVRPRRSGRGYRAARKLYYWLKRVGRQAIDADPRSRVVGQVADYQMFYSSTFNGDSQAELLSRIGFDDARAVFHSNSATIYDEAAVPFLTRLRDLVRTPVPAWFDRHITSQYFLLLACKPRQGSR